jgi:hypothetical protein
MSTTFVERALFGLVIVILGLAGVPIYKSVVADGKVQYCYVDTERHQVPNQADIVVYSLYGFRPWRTDRRIAPALKNMDEVRTEAVKYGCELR